MPWWEVKYSFFIPDDPKPKGRPRITKTKTGVPYAYTPSATLQSEWRIRQQVNNEMGALRPGDCNPEPPLTGAVKLSLVVALTPPAMPKKWQGVRKPTKRPDLDNYIKTVLDALNGIVFEDDSQVVTISASKAYCWPSNGFKPGWYIYVVDVDSGV